MSEVNQTTGRYPQPDDPFSSGLGATAGGGAVGQIDPGCDLPQEQTQPRLPVVGQIVRHLGGSGSGLFAAELARGLRDQFRFVFLCLEGVGSAGEALAAEGFSVVDLHRRLGLNWPVAGRIREAARYFGIHLLHAHQYESFFHAAKSRRFRGQPPILYTEHARPHPDKRRWRRRVANYLLFRRGDHVIAAGEFAKQALLDHEGLDEMRVEVIPDGINPQRFTSPRDPAARLATRAALGLAADQPMILQVAHFHPVKDHATAIRALAEVIEEIPSVVLVLAGEGEERAHIESLVHQMEIAPHVRFLGVRGDIPRLMAVADMLLLSSANEGVSVTLLEAMASHLPIVATAVGGNAELVGHGEAGLLSPRGRSAPLAENILRLIHDPLLRLRLGQQGSRRLQERFTQDKMHSRYAAIYHRMAAV